MFLVRQAFTAARVHERQQHPEIFVTGNEQHPEALLLENQLEDMASYEPQNGRNVRAMARVLIDRRASQTQKRSAYLSSGF